MLIVVEGYACRRLSELGWMLMAVACRVVCAEDGAATGGGGGGGGGSRSDPKPRGVPTLATSTGDSVQSWSQPAGRRLEPEVAFCLSIELR